MSSTSSLFRSCNQEKKIFLFIARMLMIVHSNFAIFQVVLCCVVYVSARKITFGTPGDPFAAFANDKDVLVPADDPNRVKHSGINITDH